MVEATASRLPSEAEGVRAATEWPASVGAQCAMAQRQMLAAGAPWLRAWSELCEDAWIRWLSLFANGARLDD